jgi:hypothetical protein
MSQRFSLFNAGFSAAAPAQFYSQLQLADQFRAHADEQVRREMEGLVNSLKAHENEYLASLSLARELASGLEITLGTLPTNPNEYFDWLPRYVEEFEHSFPMSKIDHYYFLFGRKLAELATNVRLASTCLELEASLNKALALEAKTEKYIRDNEYILFKLIAPAALLSSEPRHNYFNLLYKSMNSSFESIRKLDYRSLAVEEMRKACDELRKFENQVREGYASCSSLLKELEV